MPQLKNPNSVSVTYIILNGRRVFFQSNLRAPTKKYQSVYRQVDRIAQQFARNKSGSENAFGKVTRYAATGSSRLHVERRLPNNTVGANLSAARVLRCIIHTYTCFVLKRRLLLNFQQFPIEFFLDRNCALHSEVADSASVIHMKFRSKCGQTFKRFVHTKCNTQFAITLFVPSENIV